LEVQPTRAIQSYSAIGAIIGWLAVILQLYLILVNRVASVPETIIRFFSFFTILTNILVAFCFTVLWLKSKSDWGMFFARPSTLTAITVYITIVGLVYNAVLRFLWKPEGLQMVVDELLHSVIPVLFIVFWMIFVPKRELRWKDTLQWLLYPLAYIIYIIIRGALSDFYPYPFIDVIKLGYSHALRNTFGLLIAFLALSLLLVAIGKITSRQRQ
jgi:hypothetical protein